MHMRWLVHPNCLAAVALATLLAFWRPGAAGQLSPAPAASVAAASARYVYWTNEADGSIGRANTNGTDVNERFVKPVTADSGAGLTVNSRFVYWTSANGGTATTILRAKLDGTGVDENFIQTGKANPCGITANDSHIYWAGDVGSAIGRANLGGTGVNRNFIETGPGVCGVALTSSRIYWANYQTNWIGRAYLDGSGVQEDFIPTDAAAGLPLKVSSSTGPTQVQAQLAVRTSTAPA
jgi:hypothetical protein